METHHSKTVHLSGFLSLFSLTHSHTHIQFCSFRYAGKVCCILTLLYIWLLGLIILYLLFITQFTHNTHCSSHPLPCKLRLDPHWYVYQLASAEQPHGSQRDQSLKPVTLSWHTLFTYYRQCTVCMCSPLWRFFLSCLLTKPILLAWDDQWFTCYLWPMQLALQTFFFHTRMHSCGHAPAHLVSYRDSHKSYIRKCLQLVWCIKLSQFKSNFENNF